MSHWRKKEVEFSDMHQALLEHPGQSLHELARQFGVPASTILRRLPGMAEAGYLLYEDDRGKLYPFDKEA
jgi:DNA-binding IclR family transcriptional regulator